MVTDASFLDLRRLVRQLRSAAEERSKIPAHSGTVTSEVRRERRKQRRELGDKIQELERGIVAWALNQIPAEESNGEG